MPTQQQKLAPVRSIIADHITAPVLVDTVKKMFDEYENEKPENLHCIALMYPKQVSIGELRAMPNWRHDPAVIEETVNMMCGRLVNAVVELSTPIKKTLPVAIALPLLRQTDAASKLAIKILQEEVVPEEAVHC